MNAFIENTLEALSHVEVRNIITGAAIGSPLVVVLAFFLA